MRRKVCQGRYRDRCEVRRRLGEEEVRVWPGGVEDVGESGVDEEGVFMGDGL